MNHMQPDLDKNLHLDLQKWKNNLQIPQGWFFSSILI